MSTRSRLRGAIDAVTGADIPTTQRGMDFDVPPGSGINPPSTGAMTPTDPFLAAMSPQQRQMYAQLSQQDPERAKALRQLWESQNLPAPQQAGPPATQPGAAGPPATRDPNLPATNKDPNEMIPFDSGDAESAAKGANKRGWKDILGPIGIGAATVLGGKALYDTLEGGYDYFYGDEGMFNQDGSGGGNQPLGQGPEGLNQEGPSGPDISMDKQASMPFGGSGSPNMRDVNQAARIAKNTGMTVAEAYEQLTGYNLQTGARNPAIQPGEIMMSPMNDNMGGMNIGGDTGDGAQGPVRFRGGVTYDPNKESQRIGGSRRATPQIAAMTRQKQLDEQNRRESLLKYRNMLSPQTSMQGPHRAALNAQAMLLSGETPMGAIPDDMRQAMIMQAYPQYANVQANNMETLRELIMSQQFGTGGFNPFGPNFEQQMGRDMMNQQTREGVRNEADRLLKTQVGESNDWVLGGQLWNSITGGPDYELDEGELQADIQVLMDMDPTLTEPEARQILLSRMKALGLGKDPSGPRPPIDANSR